jgi:hypothetical protein
VTTVWPMCPEDRVQIAFLGHEITVLPDVVDAFRLVALRAVRTRYGEFLSTQPLITTPTGGYACRNRRPHPETPVTVELHSEHCHGHTVDVNWDNNPFREDGVLQTDFDRFGLDDGCDWLECWLAPPPGLTVFFRWGGGWTTDLQEACVNLGQNGQQISTGNVDGMHFELALTPEEVQGYDWQTQIDKEAAVNKQLEALVAQAADIKDAVTFTKVLTKTLAPPDQEQASAEGAAKRVAKTVTDAEEAGAVE